MTSIYQTILHQHYAKQGRPIPHILTLRDIATMMKVQTVTVKKWVTAQGLPGQRSLVKRRSFYTVTVVDWIAWADKWRPRNNNVPKHSISCPPAGWGIGAVS